MYKENLRRSDVMSSGMCSVTHAPPLCECVPMKYEHIISIGYNGRTVSTGTRDPAELGRFYTHLYTHLWWTAQEAVRRLKNSQKGESEAADDED